MCHKAAAPTHRVPTVTRSIGHQHNTVVIPAAPLRFSVIRGPLPLGTIALSDQPSVQCRNSRQHDQDQRIIQTPNTNTTTATVLSEIWPFDFALPAPLARDGFPPFTFPSSISRQCVTLLHSPSAFKAPQIAVQSDSVWLTSTACVKLLA